MRLTLTLLVFPVNFPELESELPESVDLLEEEAAEMEMGKKRKQKKTVRSLSSNGKKQ